VKNGDTEAFGTLWEKYERVLRQYFVRETRNRHEAEDLASETLIAALQAIPRFRGAALEPGSSAPDRPCTFQTYLTAIARNRLRRWRQRHRTRYEVLVGDLLTSLHPDGDDIERMEGIYSRAEDAPSNPLDLVLEEEQRETACFALASIDSTPQFKVVLLHYYADMAHQDIASLLCTRRETVNSRLQDGRKAFGRQYQKLTAALSGR
jgi:RNA polymerase sigma factor (sigma-70 family)